MTVNARLEYDACVGSWCLLDSTDINVLPSARVRVRIRAWVIEHILLTPSAVFLV